MIYLLSFLAFWLACGFVAAGWEYAYLQCEWPRLSECGRQLDRALARKQLRGGPLSIRRLAHLKRYRHGWRKWW